MHTESNNSASAAQPRHLELASGAESPRDQQHIDVRNRVDRVLRLHHEPTPHGDGSLADSDERHVKRLNAAPAARNREHLERSGHIEHLGLVEDEHTHVTLVRHGPARGCLAAVHRAI